MAYFVSLKSGTTQVLVNIEHVDYIREAGEERCVLFFGKEHSVSVDHSAYAVIGKAQDGSRIPDK